MTDLENILPLWHALEAAGADYVLATVVEVEGPSYRKPGALMLIAANGDYTYTLDTTNATVVALNTNQTVTDGFNYTITDGRGATSTSTVTITIHGDVEIIG